MKKTVNIKCWTQWLTITQTAESMCPHRIIVYVCPYVCKANGDAHGPIDAGGFVESPTEIQFSQRSYLVD